MQWQQLGPDVPAGGNRLTKTLGRSGMRLMGWKIQGEFPNRPKLIVAVAPHTSNVDFVLTVLVIWGLGLRASYLAKQSLFRFPLGMLMRAFGGIPVNRGTAHGMVEQLTERFSSQTHLVLGITPEGTRRKVREWKSGFALIASAANVPVLPAIVNYDTRIVHFQDLITDVGNADQTLATMKQLAKTTGAPRQGR